MIRAVCICLPEAPDQIVAAQKHFEESGLENVEFIWGINAPVAGLATSHCYEVDHPGSGFRMGSKPTGIWLSHLIAWNCLLRYPEDRFMVLEVDAKFEEGWKEKLEQALKDVPENFDLLFPGHCCTEGWERTHVKGLVWESKHLMCTQSYIVRRGVLPFLLKTVRKCWAPLDAQFVFEVFPYLKVYGIFPSIVSQWNTVLSP